MIWVDFAGRSLVLLLPALLLAAGTWLLCRRSRRMEADARDRGARDWLRALALFPLLPLAMLMLVHTLIVPPRFVTEESTGIVIFGSIAVFAIFPALLAVRLRHLAKRAPAPLLAVDSPIVGWTLCACLLVIPMLSLLAYFEVDLFGNRGIGEEVVMLVLVTWAAVGITSYFWMVYLLVRYALAFSRSRREAQAAFAAGDLSVSPQMQAVDAIAQGLPSPQ